MNIEDIPGYREAIERERFVRESSFLPVTESIAGFEVCQMTLRHYVTLKVIRSPFVSGGVPDAADLAKLLWVLSPKWSEDENARNVFYESCRVFSDQTEDCFLKLAHGLVEAFKYIEETFQDAPGGSKSSAFTPEYYSDAAWICAHFATEFGWDDDTLTLQKPLKRLFQYIKVSMHNNGSKTPLFNPSDKVRGEWLAEQNKAKT